MVGELIVNELIEDINNAIIEGDCEVIVNSLIAIDNYLLNDIGKDLYICLLHLLYLFF